MASNSEVALERLVDKMMAEGLGNKLKHYKYILIYAMNILADNDTSDLIYMNTINDLLHIYDVYGVPDNKIKFYEPEIEYAKKAVLMDKKLDAENMVRSMVYILQKYNVIPPEMEEWLAIANKLY